MTLHWNASRIGGCEISEPVTIEVQIDHRGHYRDGHWDAELWPFPVKPGRYWKGQPRIWEPSRSGGILDGVVMYPRTLHTPELKGRCLPGVRR